MKITGTRFVHKETSRHGEPVYYFRRQKGERIRLPDAFGSDAFRNAYDLAMRGERPEVKKIGQFERRDQRLSVIFSRLLEGARGRAKEKRLPFDLTTDWLINEVKRKGYRCAITGVALDLKRRGESGKRNPLAPSIDRIDNAFGYTPENVRIVALAVNIMLADWGVPIFDQIAMTYTANKKGIAVPAPCN